MVTVCPLEIDVLLSVMSVPVVPTVRPETWTPPAPSLKRAAAAVPVVDATPECGTPASVMTPADSVHDGFDSVITTKTAAMPAVPISSVAAAVCESHALMTAFIRVSLSVGE